MQEAYVALLVYGLWMYGLIFVMGFVRGKATKVGKITVETMDVNNRNISDFAYRVSRAHANCYENMPIFVGIVLVATMTGRIEIINGLAYVFIVARIAQTSFHLYSGSSRFIAMRGLCFMIQVILQIYWSILLLSPV